MGIGNGFLSGLVVTFRTVSKNSLDKKSYSLCDTEVGLVSGTLSTCKL